MNVLIQTCAGSIAKTNFDKTLKNSYSIDEISKCVEPEVIKDLNDSGCNHFGLWGVTPDLGKMNAQWRKIKNDDIVLFSKNKRIFAYGKIVTKFRNAEFANELWGRKNENDTWEYMYVIKNITIVDYPVLDIMKLIGYNKDYFQKTVLLDLKKSQAILREFDFSTLEEYDDGFDDEDESEDDLGDTDKKRIVNTRKEQKRIKKYLFKTKGYRKCAICGKMFDEDFLWASHLKKRQLCSHQERMDIENIALPMCLFGCDKIYENGYVGVKNGEVIKLKNSDNPNVQIYIENQIGNVCLYFNIKNEKYFNFHNNTETDE